jgi:ubiquitin-protein ligase E3 C
MYQSFTGQSRRPRQVNLSGRPSNPFAAASANAGPQSTIASAQHERLQRQLQREKIQASSRIQRVWRGHRARRRAFQSWREIWDVAEEQPRSDGVYASAEESLSQLNRLLLFYSPKKEPSDVKRLGWYGMKQMSTSEKVPCEGGKWLQAYAKLRQACLVALKTKGGTEDADLSSTILNVLAFAANPLKRSAEMDKAHAVAYYETLTSLSGVSEDALQNALIAPLGTEGGYAGVAVLLGHPLSPQMLSLLKSAVHRPSLIEALSQAHDLQWSTRSRLWLLGNLNFLCGRTRAGITTTVAGLLGSLADEVDFESAPLDIENVAFDRDILSKATSDLPLNTFLYEQTSALVNQESVRNLLVRNSRTSEPQHEDTTNAQLFANYALTLLRCFPRKADDIRMWLYLGPSNSHDVPATRFFWNATKATSVFSTVSKNSRDVVGLLRSSNAASQKDDWTVILVFLELYTFLLKIMDDEEFMGKAVGGSQSAIPVEDVAILVTFLKNLGFTLYFNAAELNEQATSSARETGSLSAHFGGRTNSEPADEVEPKPLTLAGMPGMTSDYLKGIATGLLRSIYERDSRRHFLPTDHWLMTSRFDMTAFIPGVVAEEENRHRLAEQEEEDLGADDSDDDMFNTSPRGPAGYHRNQEARARAQRKIQRRRHLESVAPRLEILQNMPFFIPFHTRVEIFRQFVHLDQHKRRHGLVDPDTWRANMMFAPQEHGRNMLARHHAQIKRKSEFEDAYQAFYDLGTALKEPIQITFLDEFGLQEAGIDGGGVTKEFLTSVINQAFDPASGGMEKYFIENEKHLLFPNPTALDDARVMLQDMSLKESEVRVLVREMLRKYEFLGRIIGKCLYEEILVDVSFAGFFLKKWALTGGHNGSAPGETGYRANINDLRDFDEALYKGLLDVKSAPDASAYGLTFTIDDLVGPADKKRVIERELIPHGSDTPVTNENRLIYLNRMSWYRLQGQSAPQTNAFLKGLSSIVQPSWLSMFNQAELQTLIGGAQAGIDVQDLRRNTQYGGVYAIGDDGLEHPSVIHFWKVMESLPDADRRKVLKFVTSTPRGPLLGFAHLNPRFSIRDSSSDQGRIPTASTCVNLLKLPMYKSEKALREKLLYAVNSGAGFDLS